MNETKLYTVIELSEMVGVPRTTINDWLGKYAQYVDASMQGKRRMYSEHTLQMLRKVSELRASGLSGFEIEQKLPTFCTIIPETRHETDAPSAQQASSGTATSGQGVTALPHDSVPPSSSGGDYALVSQHDSGDVVRFVGEQFESMLDKMHAMELESRKSGRRSLLFSWLLVLILLCLGVVLGAFFLYRNAMLERTAAQNERLSAIRDDAARQSESLRLLNEQSVNLSRYSETLQEDVARLHTGMKEQKDAFDRSIQEAKTNFEQTRDAETKRRDAELALEREKFAAERLKLLRSLDRLASDNESVVRELKEKQREIEEELSELRLKQSEPQAPDVPGDSGDGAAAAPAANARPVIPEILPDVSGAPSPGT